MAGPRASCVWRRAAAHNNDAPFVPHCQIMVSPTHKRHGDFCCNAWNKHRLELQTWSEWREKAVTELTGLFLHQLFSLIHSLTLCFSFNQTRHTKTIQQTMHDREINMDIFQGDAIELLGCSGWLLGCFYAFARMLECSRCDCQSVAMQLSGCSVWLPMCCFEVARILWWLPGYC